MYPDLFLGLDLGTTGARAVVIDVNGNERSSFKSALSDFGINPRNPQIWWRAASAALNGALSQVDRNRIAALAVDGTSGTMLAVDTMGMPLADGLMYNDSCQDAAILETIASHAPHNSAAHGPTSGLARALLLQPLGGSKLLHQADWIAWHFSGQMISDTNNALKTGYDPVLGQWPDWIAATNLNLALLPDVVEPGTFVGDITVAAATTFGLPNHTKIVAGTTDGCASFVATGATLPGEGVTVIGTTLTLKILSDRAIFSPEFGIYSHRILGNWLAGGASNSGGSALLAHFTVEEIEALTRTLVPDQPTGLSYYPLPKPGERFPIVDPKLVSRTTPRPSSDTTFLQALFEGIAGIEALGFARLAELGAPELRSVRSLGGAAGYKAFNTIRARTLNVPMLTAKSDEAAFGAALLAQRGAA
ncbi:MAG: carbohydrate kinase [Alphaproteobacteria bacterium]|nr:FGGY-family carbohydrate kinase [Beijerinckiaceae bacterium]NBQ38484.1 carbohydrate kinase [Alphaproteobacteria bacterium]